MILTYISCSIDFVRLYDVSVISATIVPRIFKLHMFLLDMLVRLYNGPLFIDNMTSKKACIRRWHCPAGQVTCYTNLTKSFYLIFCLSICFDPVTLTCISSSIDFALWWSRSKRTATTQHLTPAALSDFRFYSTSIKIHHNLFITLLLGSIA